jgi:cysteine desulfurase
MAPERPIYLDHHATTPVDPRVLEAMAPYWSDAFGNASSATHRYGWEAEAAVETARERIAAAIGAADPREIVFTSGTTESDNLALQGLARAGRRRGNHIAVSSIEHPAVLDPCRALEAEGHRVTRLPVDGEGLVDPAAVEATISERTLLVSIMAANGEIGVVQPLEAISRVCRERGVPLHTDAAQAVGRIPVHVDRLGVDLLSLCAHKLYGPKGVGALYVRRRRPRLRLQPLLHGGGQEGGLRPGTLPVALIVGFARRDHLRHRLETELSGIRVNGHPTRRLPGNLNVSFEGAEADGLIAALPDLALSSGSACASASGRPSHVLLAIGLSEAAARSSLRFGLGRPNTREQIDRAAERIVAAVKSARQSMPGFEKTALF